MGHDPSGSQITFSQGLLKSIRKHRYFITIHNSSNENNLWLGVITTWGSLLKCRIIRKVGNHWTKGLCYHTGLFYQLLLIPSNVCQLFFWMLSSNNHLTVHSFCLQYHLHISFLLGTLCSCYYYTKVSHTPDSKGLKEKAHQLLLFNGHPNI